MGVVPSGSVPLPWPHTKRENDALAKELAKTEHAFRGFSLSLRAGVISINELRKKLFTSNYELPSESQYGLDTSAIMKQSIEEESCEPMQPPPINPRRKFSRCD